MQEAMSEYQKEVWQECCVEGNETLKKVQPPKTETSKSAVIRLK